MFKIEGTACTLVRKAAGRCVPHLRANEKSHSCSILHFECAGNAALNLLKVSSGTQYEITDIYSRNNVCIKGCFGISSKTSACFQKKD